VKDLILNVKKIYFDQIKSGEKKWEFREVKPYWKKRLIDRDYTGVQIRMGYPKNTDKARILRFKWHKHLVTIQKVDFMDKGFEWVYTIALMVPLEFKII